MVAILVMPSDITPIFTPAPETPVWLINWSALIIETPLPLIAPEVFGVSEGVTVPFLPFGFGATGGIWGSA